MFWFRRLLKMTKETSKRTGRRKSQRKKSSQSKKNSKARSKPSNTKKVTKASKKDTFMRLSVDFGSHRNYYRLPRKWCPAFYNFIVNNKELKHSVKTKHGFKKKLWESLTDSWWISPVGEAYCMSWRVAEEVIKILDDNDEQILYMCGFAGKVDPSVRNILKKKGWTYPQGTPSLVYRKP